MFSGVRKLCFTSSLLHTFRSSSIHAKAINAMQVSLYHTFEFLTSFDINPPRLQDNKASRCLMQVLGRGLSNVQRSIGATRDIGRFDLEADFHALIRGCL